MELIKLLSFLTVKYKQAETEKEQYEISTLYWSVLDYGLHEFNNINVSVQSGLKTPILN